MDTNMSPESILELLGRKKITQSGLARDLGVKPPSVWGVIRGKNTSVRIQNHIARAVDLPRSAIWPETMVDEAGQARRGRPRTRGLFDDKNMNRVG